MSELVIEKSIQKRYYDHLKTKYPQDVLVMNWEGWMEKVGQITPTDNPHKGSRLTPFHSEFDIARFSRIIENGKVVDLILYGYEVKGVHPLQDGKWEYPRITEGIDQALTLLFQNADYSFLITPRPEKEWDYEALIRFRDRYTPLIGLIFAEVDGKFTESDLRERNTTNKQEKIDSLIGLHLSGKYKKGSLIGKLWGRNTASFDSPTNQT